MSATASINEEDSKIHDIAASNLLSIVDKVNKAINLGAHKGERVRELIERRGCGLLFLLAYSPDFSPIEEAFSKLKVRFGRAKERTTQALVEAIGQALDAITPGDAKG